MATEFREKRFSVRVPLSLPVSGKIGQGFFRSHKFEGETEDVSVDGLCINVAVPNGFSKGQKIKLRTRLYKGDFLIKATGVVRWADTRNRPEGPIRMGIELRGVGHPSHWYKRIEDEIVLGTHLK